MSTGSAQQTSTTTAGVSPFAQNYVDTMLGAGQQEIFNTQKDPTTGKTSITGIKPYVPFGAPMDAQGNVVPYGGQPQGMGWGSYGGQQGGYGQPQPQYQDYFNTPAALRGRFAGTDDSGMGRGAYPQRTPGAEPFPAYGGQQGGYGQPPATQQQNPPGMNLFQQLQNLSNRAQQPSTYTPTPQQDFGTYGFDQNVTDYLNKQRQGAATDAGIDYTYDPATKTFKGATMGGGTFTKTLDEIKQEADIINPANVPPPPGGVAVDPNDRLRTADGKQFFSSGQWWPNETVQAFGGMGGMGGSGMMANLFGGQQAGQYQQPQTPTAQEDQIMGQSTDITHPGMVFEQYQNYGMGRLPANYEEGSSRAQQYPQYQQPNTGYPTGTMQAGMGPGEQLAAESSVAGPSALQQRAYQSAYNMQTPGQYGQATDIGQAAGLGLLNTAGQAQGLQSLAQQAIQQGKQYGQDITNASKLQQAMDPYMQNVVNARQREAIRQSNILARNNRAAAVKAGAFGGSGSALMEAERQRNLATQLEDIQAGGLQGAYQNAQQQMLNAQNQAMQGYNTGIQGYGQGIQGQTGAYGQAASSAGTLSNIGGQQLGSQQSIANLQNTFGQQQQQRQQQIINQAIQNYNMRRMYPQQQLSYMGSLLSGLPVSSTGNVTNIPAPNMASQIAGLGMTGIGAAGLYQNLTGKGIGSLFGFKKGGQVKRPQVGGNGLMDAALRKIGA